MGQSFQITFGAERGFDGTAQVWISHNPRPPGQDYVWEGGTRTITGGEDYTVTAPGISTPGSYHAVVVFVQSGSGSIEQADAFFSVDSPSLGQATAITAATFSHITRSFTYHSWTGTPIVSTTVTVSHTHTRWTDPSPPYPWPPPGYYPPPAGSCDPNNPYGHVGILSVHLMWLSGNSYSKWYYQLRPLW